MFDGKVSLDIPTTLVINEDATRFSLYPLKLNTLPIIIKSIGSYFIPIVDKTENTSGPYVDENNTVAITYGNSIKLELKAVNSTDIQNGIIVSGSQAQNLTYVWRKNNQIIVSNNRILINEDSITILSLVDSDNGTYVCEVSNDVGATLSDSLTVDVLDLLLMKEFNNNLVQNYDGSQNLASWAEVSTQGNQITTKRFLNNSRKTILSQDPSLDAQITSYVYPDHFNENEINSAVFTFSDEKTSNEALISQKENSQLLGNATYFTRNPLVSYVNNGSNRVQLYQDIGLESLTRYINGTIAGVSGLGIDFQCFIGNSISYFIPKKNKKQTKGRIVTDIYGFESALSEPRLSPDNVEFTEVAFEDVTTVFIEEYQDDNLIKMHTPIYDPYRSTYTLETITPTNSSPPFKTGNIVYTNERFADVSSIGSSLPKYYKDIDKPPSNLGQLVTLRKLNVPKLGYATNKIRIRVEFYHKGLQQPQGDSPASLVKDFPASTIYIIPTWMQDKTTEHKYMVDSYTFGRSQTKKNATNEDLLPLYGQPRNFITGFVLYVSPIITATNAERLLQERGGINI